MTSAVLSRCLLAALRAADEAGKAILDVYSDAFDVRFKDADRSPLTIADTRSHDIIVNHLAAMPRPFPVVSEEGKHTPYDVRKTWDPFWLVDPLDGTKEFVKRNGEFTVNIALIENTRPVMGVIFVPVRGTVYFALRGFGAHRTTAEEMRPYLGADKPGTEAAELVREAIGRSSALPLAQGGPDPLMVVGSRSHRSAEFDAFVSALKGKCARVEITDAGSSLKFCLVAEGQAHLYPRFGPTMEWDTAAGQIIVEESGGEVLEIGTHRPLPYNKRELLNPWFIAGRRDAIRDMSPAPGSEA